MDSISKDSEQAYSTLVYSGLDYSIFVYFFKKSSLEKLNGIQFVLTNILTQDLRPE